MQAKIYHKCLECGEEAFQYKNMPYVGMQMNASDIIHDERPQPGDDITCQNCQRPIPPKDLIIDNVIIVQE